MEITSVNNDLVKKVVKLQQKKYRTESGLFLIEGYKSIKEGFELGIELKEVFVLAEKIEKYKFLKDVISTNEAVLKKISTTDTPPESVAVAVQPDNNFDRLKTSKKVVLLENISDAGNLGTIIRSAAAFNIDSVVLLGNTVDLYNPKCVRSAVGNLWKVNVVNVKSLSEIQDIFKSYERVATLPKENNTVWLSDWTPKDKVLVMLGSEADGLTGELKNWATTNLTIEMNKGVESLNLSVSAGIVMYKLDNQNN